jgi:hypothetical protein
MMKHKNFLAVIMTHGRPNIVHTYNALLKSGYTGPVCIVIDNEDKTAAEYKEKFGDMVYVFDKKKEAETTDVCDNFPHRKAIVYARNAAFRITKELGYRYFVQLDDDYTSFEYKSGKDHEFISSKRIKNLNHIFDLMIDYLILGDWDSIAMAQGGDFIAGKNGYVKNALKTKRKCMNTWICDIEKPLRFCGHMNEDASCYIVEGLRGKKFLTLFNLSITPVQTQAAAGGMTELYNANGTYVKTFYSILQAPSCVKINHMGHINPRIHHNVKWNNACPKIIRQEWKKAKKQQKK